MEVDQVFIRGNSREYVEENLTAILNDQGYVIELSNLPLPSRYEQGIRKRYRHFYIALPITGWVCILESKGTDEQLAKALSLRMGVEGIWISYSDRAEEFSFSTYKSGDLQEEQTIRPAEIEKKRVLSYTFFRSRSRSENDLTSKGHQFYRSRGLPWPFYSYEQVDESPNKEEYFRHLNFSRSG